MEEIGKDEDVNQQNLLSFSDIELSNLQIELVRNKKSMISKYNEKIKELKESNTVLRIEVEKNKKNGEEREAELEQMIKNEKDKNRQIQKQFTEQKNEMMQNIVKLEESLLNLKS